MSTGALPEVSHVKDHLPVNSYAAGFAVIVAVETNRLLLLRANGDNHLWQLPGGVVEPGETALAGVRREISEELGGALLVGDVVVTRFENPSRNGITDGVVYVPVSVGTEFTPSLSAEHDGFVWTSIPELGRYSVDSPLDARGLAALLEPIHRLCATEHSSRLAIDGRQL